MSKSDEKPWYEPLERLADWRPPGWLWPAILVFCGLMTFGMSWVFSPVSETVVAIAGYPMTAGTCAFLESTGFGCPSCGMTRSWIHSARGNVLGGFLFNPAGALLFWWFIVGGVLGSVRLITGNYTKWRVKSWAFASWAAFWCLVPYSLGWLLRVGMGVNPLP